MPAVEKSALVHHSAAEMYDLVNDVDRYQEFLPWCKDSRMLSHEGDRMCGELVVSKSGITQTFSTCNTLVQDRQIRLQLNEGPFS